MSFPGVRTLWRIHLADIDGPREDPIRANYNPLTAAIPQRQMNLFSVCRFSLKG